MILLISCVFPPEPVVSASLVYDLAVALSNITDVKVLTPRPSRPLGFSFTEETDKNTGFEHILVNSFIYAKPNIFGRVLESYSFGKSAVDYITKHRTKISCIYLNAWPLIAQYLIVNISKKYSIPTINHVQDIYPESLATKFPFFNTIVSKSLFPIDKYIQRNAIKVIAISENMATTLAKTRGIDRKKIEVIYNWQSECKININNMFQEYQISDDLSSKQFTFMFLGNIGPVAGVDFLIKGYAKANLDSTHLIIAGSGSKKKKSIEVAKTFKNSNISFFHVPEGKVLETQASADVLLLAVKRGAALSSIPSKLIAYMLSAKPIIACVDEDSDTASSIKQAKCGWIVPPENTEALAKAMKIAVNEPKENLIKYGNNGLLYAQEKYSKERNLSKLLEVILEILDVPNAKFM